MKILLLIFSIFLSTTTFAVEYGSVLLEPPEADLFENGFVEGKSKKTITLSEGDSFLMRTSATIDDNGKYFRDYEPLILIDLNEGDIFENLDRSSDVKFSLIVGPCKVVLLNDNWNSNNLKRVYYAYQLTRASSTIYSSTSATIPAIEGQNWNVELEYSQDLINWSSVAPGTATGSSELQFYRVKVTDTGD